jgi:hypothetical protein
MAIEHLYTILCEYLIRATDGKMSAAGIYQNIRTREFPATKDPMGVIVAFTGEEGDAFDVLLEGPGMPSGSMMGGVVPPSVVGHGLEQRVQTVAVEARPAVFREPGVHRIVLRSGDQVIHEYPFGVFKAAAEQGGDDDG